MPQVGMEFIQAHLHSIQVQLREIKIIADLDRRNTRSMHDNLAAEMACQFDELNIKLGAGVGGLATLIDDRFNRLIEVIRNK